MTEFHEKLEAIVRKEFPDTEAVRYFISQYSDKRHIFLVFRDWEKDGTPWTAHCAFDDRQGLGALDIKARINVMIASCPPDT